MSPNERDMPASADELLEQAEAQMIEQRDRARRFLLSLDQQILDLQTLRRGGKKSKTIEAYRYANMEFIDAFKLYLQQTQRPWSEDDLVAEALNGGCYANRGEGPRGKARGDAEVQARKSLIYFLATPEEKRQKRDQAIAKGKKFKKAPNLKPAELKKLNGLIGLAEWPEEKFKV